jgi:tripartite-type tricarboxylate transporter receptor subunit TctC
VHVPYRGGGQVMTDLMAGRVSYVFAVLPTARPFIAGGQLRALATTGMIRLDNVSKQHGHQILFIEASMGAAEGRKEQAWSGRTAPASPRCSA